MEHTIAPTTQTLEGIDVIPRGRIGRFIVEREIGHGSVGTVYQFRDPLIGRKVAIKVLKPLMPADERQAFEKYFIQEARAAGRLNHPNIVTIYDADKTDDLLYIAMEHLEGKELRDLIVNGHTFNYRQIADMMARVAKALDYAHQNGVIHRDIKPANIFIVGKYTPKVLDFGIAGASRQAVDFDATLGETTVSERKLIGTPSYMSPEQTRAENVDARTDIFSLGVVLYQLLCGQLPFKGENLQDLFESIEYDMPVPPNEIRSDVPPRLAYIAGKAMAKKPTDRYATAGDMAADLNRYIAKERTNQIIATLREPDDGKSAAQGSAAQNKSSATLKDKWLQRIIGTVIVVVTAAIGVYLWGSKNIESKDAALQSAAQPASSKISSGKIAKAKAPSSKLIEPSAAPVNAEQTINTPEENSSAPKLAAEAGNETKQEAKVEIKPAAKSRQKSSTATVAAMGTVAIAVTPWGEVYVDGKSKGVAPPLSKLTLPAGTHRIEIRNGEDKYTTKIRVTAGNETKVGHQF
jgi:serine/threonine protein kinase